MTGVLAVGAGALFGVGTYLLLQRALSRIVIGLALLSHAVNLALLAAGGAAGRPPFAGEDVAAVADPLPQALVLTAIVISFATTAFLLALAWRSWLVDRHDEVEDDLEDRRIAALAASARPSSEEMTA